MLLLLLLAFPLQVVGAKFNDSRTPFFSHMPQMRPLLLVPLPLLSFLIPSSLSSPLLAAFVTAYCNRFAVVVVVVALGKKLYYTMRAESQFARYFPAKTSKQKQSNVQRYVYLILIFLLLSLSSSRVSLTVWKGGRVIGVAWVAGSFCCRTGSVCFRYARLPAAKCRALLRFFAHFQLHFPAWRIIILPKERGVWGRGI